MIGIPKIFFEPRLQAAMSPSVEPFLPCGEILGGENQIKLD
jgi:hypothetical protein